MGISPTTAKNQFIEAMIKNGATLPACTMWFTLMASASTSEDHLEYVWRLTDLAKHIECHPVNIITTCLSQGKFTKVDEEMMKCVWQMVSDDTESQRDTDEFWKDAEGEVEIVSKKTGLECTEELSASSDSHSYEEEQECCCEHGIVGYCAECHSEDEPRETSSDQPPFWMDHVEVAPSKAEASRGVKRKLVPRALVESQA